MYIKLTKFDNTPIWLNAAFIVTVEPRREGVGSIVVPIGDGLDYDVRESPETVLAMLEGAPVPAVVPVPPPAALTHTPEDVSPEPEFKPLPEPETKPAKRRTVRKAAAKPPKARKAEAALTAPDIERLRKMAPGSVKKLANTLASQFKIGDADGAIKSLTDQGVLTLDSDHVLWK